MFAAHNHVMTGSAGDPFATSVITLLHFDGSLTDSSGTATWSGSAPANGSAKFGSASLSCSGSNYIYSSDFPSSGFGSGDFTLEMWVNPSATQTYKGIFDLCGSAGLLFTNASGGFQYRKPNYQGSDISGGSYTAGTWVHVAVVRASNLTHMYVGGTEVGTPLSDSDSYAKVGTPAIGAVQGGSQNFYGLIDELRITKAARYTTNFTPSSTAFTP